jgi:hypothetical protein
MDRQGYHQRGRTFLWTYVGGHFHGHVDTYKVRPLAGCVPVSELPSTHAPTNPSSPVDHPMLNRMSTHLFCTHIRSPYGPIMTHANIYTTGVSVWYDSTSHKCMHEALNRSASVKMRAYLRDWHGAMGDGALWQIQPDARPIARCGWLK